MRSIVPVLVLAACARTGAPAPNTEAPRTVALLAINDTYRAAGLGDGRGGMGRVRTLRAELEQTHPDLLFVHAGDVLFPSIQSRSFKGGQMVAALDALDGAPGAFDARMFVTIGNHEFDGSAEVLRARLDESEFTWFDTNITWGDEAIAAHERLAPHALVESGGVKVGLFGLTIDSAQPAWVTGFADPEATARETIHALKEQGAELVVGLTHLDAREDQRLLSVLGPEGLDLILGGHDHAKMAVEVDGRWVLKADADAATATRVIVTMGEDGPSVDWEHVALGPEVPSDPTVQAIVDDWTGRFDQAFCVEKLQLEAGCLEDRVGSTRVTLVAEELEIRRFETNLGDWIADRVREAWAPKGAQAALLNAGSLRLNEDVPAGPITRADVEGIFAYPSPTRLVRVTGAELKAVVDHAVSDWTGSGHWLQVSGVAYRHDPATGASSLTLLAPEGPRPVRADETLLVAVPDFLVDPSHGQDGYTMLTPDHVVDRGEELPQVKQLVLDALAATDAEGIAPALEGRICSVGVEGPCLATP